MVSGKDDAADRPEHVSGTEAGASGSAQPESEFGPSLNDFGPAMNEFGPSLKGFGPAPDSGTPGWAPAPGAPGPDLSWAPATSGQGPEVGWSPAAPGPEVAWSPAPAAPNPELAWRPAEGAAPFPATGQYPPVADPEQTVKFGTAAAAPLGDQVPEHAAAQENSRSEESGAAAPTSWWRSAPSGFPPVPPAESGDPRESLSWADDPIAQALTPKTPPPQQQSGKSKGRIAAIAGGVVAVLAIAGGVGFAVTRGGGDKDATPAAVATSKSSVAGTSAGTTPAELSCPAKHDGPLTIGNGPGGVGSGVDAILGFQHAFYGDRSGVKARSFVAPDSPTVSPAETIQQAIDTVIPAGTSYCLRIVETGAESYDADLTEHRPDGTTTVYRQRITTVNRDGKHLIFSIDER